MACYYRGAPSEFASGVSQPALHPGAGEESNGLAGASGRCAGFRRGSPARLRTRSRRRPSNRESAGRSADLEIREKRNDGTLQAGEVAKEGRERSPAVVTSSVASEAAVDSRPLPGYPRD